MNRPKCDFDEVEKAMIHVFDWHFEVIFCFLSTPKFEFVEVEKAMFQGTPCTGIHFLPIEHAEMLLG